MRVSYSTLVKAKRAGRATSVRVTPTGTAVTEYQVPLGQRHSLKEAGVIGLPSWSEKATQSETWAKIPRLSATCPRRVVAFDGGKGNVDRCMEFGDEFAGSTLDTSKWTSIGATFAVSGGGLAVTGDGLVRSNTAYGTGYAIRSRLKSAHWSTAVPYEIFGVWNNSPTTRISAVFSGAGGYGKNTRNHNGADSFQGFTDWAADTYGTIECQRGASAAIWVIRATTYTHTTNYPTAVGYVEFEVSPAGGSKQRLDVDWVFVRKYVVSEPLTGTAKPSATNRALSQPMSHADLMRACCA